MKRESLGWVVAALLVAAMAMAANENVAAVGRYQLVPVSYPHIDIEALKGDSKQGVVDIETVMRIDTATGQTWCFVSNSSVIGWDPISDIKAAKAP
jgi:hypothetical protein